MGRTLLLGSPGTTWRDWLKSNRRNRDLVCLDPADANVGFPGRLTLLSGEKTAAWRFFGSLDPLRFPHVMLAGLGRLLALAGDDALVELPVYRPSPLGFHMARLVAQLACPTDILVASDLDISLDGWPVGPLQTELPAAFPEMVQAAQRKAQWLKLVEQCEVHEFTLSGLVVEGTRLGSGRRLTLAELSAAGLVGTYAEVCGGTLLVITSHVMDERAVTRALDHLHCSKVVFATTDAYDYLLCSFARDSGEDFGIGIIREIDFETGRVHAICTAVSPAPVRILRLGSLRVDERGRELGETRPWQV